MLAIIENCLLAHFVDCVDVSVVICTVQCYRLQGRKCCGLWL